MHLPKGLGSILPRYWGTIAREVTASLRDHYDYAGPNLLLNTDPHTGALGAEMWGAVYAATPAEWVVKITADEREAIAFQDLSLSAPLRSHPGVVYFADAWQLEEKTAAWDYGGYDYYTVYVLLREAVTPLQQYYGHDGGLLKENDLTQHLVIARDLLDKVRDMSVDYDHDRGKPGVSPIAVIERLVEIERTFPELQDVAEFMRLYLNASGFALADVHMGNLGMPANSDTWTIFDLGHPVTVGPPLTTPLFKVLHPDTPATSGRAP